MSKQTFQRGFTLTELLIVVVVVGILAAIAIPAWSRFLAKHRVEVVQGKLHQAIQAAQLSSQQKSISWQFSVREASDAVEMAVHASNNLASDTIWEALDTSVQLDEETTLATSGNVHYVQFDEKGNVRYRLGRVTVSSKQFPDIKRCVIVSTLIGATRTAQERPIPDPDYTTRDRFCY